MRSAVQCTACGTWRLKENGEITRARKAGLNLYCNRTCAGVGRRKEPITEAEQKAAKRQYDIEYRAKNADRLKAEKAERFRRTYDPAKAAVERRARMPRHIEYCRQPEYRKWKADYDRKFRAQKQFGPFAEAFLVLQDLQTEVLSRASRYEIDLQNGKLNKATNRRRDYDKTIGG